jgi:multidrug efflux pump subunit AcrB
MSDAPHHTHTSHPAPKSGLIGWFLGNHVAANILMLLFIIGGIISITSMRTETFPQIDPRLITVSVPYPGATPYEVAEGITDRVEDALIGIEGVKRITGTASEGHGTIRVELQDFINADDVYNDVETAVNSLLDFPPEDAERPIISKARITPGVLTLALHGEVDEHTLTYWAETIEDELQQLPGVALTSLRGVRDYQISIEVAENTLQQHGLSLADIQRAVQQFSRDIPAGTVEARQGDISLRIQERRYTGEEFAAIPVRSRTDGAILTIGDIATVVDGFDDINMISRYEGEPAALIDVKRSESDDTLAVAATVKAYMARMALPAGLTLSLQNDRTVALKDRISLMLRNAVIGFMLVFLILLLFLDLKLAFWTSAAIPISFFGGMMIVSAMGYSMNMISLFALIVVLGVVVDDAIIVGESIFDAQSTTPKAPHATLRGVLAVLAPVTVGVTTTMAAFAPLALSTGTLGQIISIIPVVVIAILFISLLEAYFILPAHLSHPGMWSRGIVADTRTRFSDALAHFTRHRLVPAARFAIRWRYATIAAFFAVAIITFSLVSSGTVRFIFFPNIEADQVDIDVTMPEGTPFAVTRQTMLDIEREVQKVRKETAQNDGHDIFESVFLAVGQRSMEGGPGRSAAASAANNIGQVKISLVPSGERSVGSGDIEAMVRARIQHFPNIETLEFRSSLVGDEPDINIELAHPDEATLNTAAESLVAALNRIPGTKEVTDSYEPGKPEYVFSLTPEGLAVGLTPNDIGTQLRAAFFGLEAQRFQRGSAEVIAYVRYPKSDRENIAALQEMRIRLADGSEVPLRSVARINEQRGFSEIRTVNGKRIVAVTADADPAITTPNDILARMRSDILPQLMQRHAGLSYSFEGETREQREDLASLGRNMLMALLLIYILLGAQLRSYVQPFVIMSAIPFGVVGAILGHFFLGYDLTFISLFGVVALSGVVVNDSVVLVDYLNKQHRDGVPFEQATLRAIERRFRPILLTTLSTCLGLLPILLETSLQARFLIPMVVSLSMGILFATVIIMFLVPCLILIVEDIKTLGRRLTRRIA